MNPDMNGQAAQRRGLPVWLWVIIGLFGLLILVVATLAVGGIYIARQFAKNPRAMVETIVRHDPNLEIVSDDGTGTITLRDKRHGKTFTVNYDDVRRGNIRIEGDNGEKVVVHADGRGVDVQDPGKNTSAHIGTGSARVPAWIPAYPASRPEGAVTAVENGEASGAFHFVTDDDPQKVRKYYEDTLRQQGFSQHEEDGEMKFDEAAHHRKIGIRVSGGQPTSVTVGFTEKRE
jgi:hypothetical protein